jgi:hypothetical protein
VSMFCEPAPCIVYHQSWPIRFHVPCS